MPQVTIRRPDNLKAENRLPTQADRHNSGFFIKQKKELTSLPVVRYGSVIEKVV
jgi:hypothetical protein